MTPAEFNKAMGTVIRNQRKARALTMEEVGDQLGFSYQQVQKYETGVNGCSAELLVRIAAILGQTVNEMYEQAGVVNSSATPSQAESAGFLAARYVSRIKDPQVRASIVDFTRKLAYAGAAA